MQSRFASNSNVSGNDQKTTPVPDEQPKGPNMDTSLHVSEEQAEYDKITGGTPPDIEQGTPVQEVGFSKVRSKQSAANTRNRFCSATKSPPIKSLKS